MLGLWVYIPTPEVWLLGWGLVPCCADKSGLQSAVEGLRPGPALAVGSCFRLRVLCQGHCPGDGTSARAQAAPGVEQPGDPSTALQRCPRPVGLCTLHCHPWGRSSPMGQVWARMQSSRKSPGILAMNMTQQCALRSPVQEKHLKPGLNPVKDHQASEELEHRLFKGRLRLLALPSLQRCFRENSVLSAVTWGRVWGTFIHTLPEVPSGRMSGSLQHGEF